MDRTSGPAHTWASSHSRSGTFYLVSDAESLLREWGGARWPFLPSGCCGEEAGGVAACGPASPGSSRQLSGEGVVLGAVGDRLALCRFAPSCRLSVLLSGLSWCQEGKLRLGRPVVWPQAHTVHQVEAGA